MPSLFVWCDSAAKLEAVISRRIVNQFEALIFDSLCIIVSSHRYVVLFVGVNFFFFLHSLAHFCFCFSCSSVIGLWHRPQRPISSLPFLKAVRRTKPYSYATWSFVSRYDPPSHAVYLMVSFSNVYALILRCYKPWADLSKVVFAASACHICSWLF